MLFEDSFNHQTDWAPRRKISGSIFGVCNAGGGSVPCDTIGGSPLGWSAWRNSEFWNPLDPTYGVAGSKPTIQITGDIAYDLGAGNKAYVQWNESNKNGSGGDGWGADGILAKVLDAPVREVYFQVRIKFMPGFRWHWDAGQNSGALKILRVAYYQNNVSRPPYKSDSPFQAFQDGNLGPEYIFNLSHKEAPYSFTAYNSNRCNPVNYDYVNLDGFSYRCIKSHTADPSNMPTGPQGTTYWAKSNGMGGTYTPSFPPWSAGTRYRQDNYYCNESGQSSAQWNFQSPVFLPGGASSNSFEDTLGNGSWHTVKIHLKMNSAPGMSDGLEELWIDGHLSFSKTGLQFRSAQGDPAAGWNLFGIGGNAFNNYSDTWRSGNYNTWARGSTVVYNGYQWTATQDTFAIPNNSAPDAHPSYWTKGNFVPSAEQWYAIDDVVISAADIPADYVIPGN